MTLTEQINAIAGLINKASASNGAGMPSEAEKRLEEIQDILNETTDPEPGAEKLNGTACPNCGHIPQG